MLQPTETAASTPGSTTPNFRQLAPAAVAIFAATAATAVLPPTAGGGTTSAPPAGPGGTAAAAPSPFGGIFPFILFGFLGLLIMTTILGPRKEKKRREAMMSTLKRHDRVQTIGGVVGSIVELKQDSIVLKVDESSNTRITFARSAIQQVLTSREDAPAQPDLASTPS